MWVFYISVRTINGLPNNAIIYSYYYHNPFQYPGGWKTLIIMTFGRIFYIITLTKNSLLGVTHSLLWIENFTMRAVIGLQEELDKRHNIDSFFCQYAERFFANLRQWWFWEPATTFSKRKTIYNWQKIVCARISAMHKLFIPFVLTWEISLWLSESRDELYIYYNQVLQMPKINTVFNRLTIFIMHQKW